MTELKLRIHDESNGLDYVLVGDYYVPDLKLPEEHRPIGMWGRLHRTYEEFLIFLENRLTRASRFKQRKDGVYTGRLRAMKPDI